jgi:hypothetical protein
MSAPEGLAPEAARTAGSSHLFHPSPDAAGVAQASIWLRALCSASGPTLSAWRSINCALRRLAARSGCAATSGSNDRRSISRDTS